MKKNESIFIEDELREKYFEYFAKGPKGYPYLDIFDLKERNAVELKLIEIDPIHRGKGIGRQIMNDLIKWADKNNKIIVLSPSEIKTNKLIKWYKEFGFVENKGRNKDFRFMNRMVRYPKGATRSKWIDSENMKINPSKGENMRHMRKTRRNPKVDIDSLDDMTRQYLETALWSEVDYDEMPMDSKYSIEDLDHEFVQQAQKDCEEFMEKAEAFLTEEELDASQIGHDFWLTRNHHGAGFWDGDYEYGDKLTKIAHEFGEAYIQEAVQTKQNPSRNIEIDQALVRDLYLTLDNESDFYRDYLLPLYKASEKYYRKGQYDSESFINSLQKRINDYTIHGPYHFSYNRKFFDMIPKKEREAVARMFEEYFIAELEAGNGWLGNIKNNPVQVNFNNYRDQLNEDDIEQIVILLCQRCRPDKYARLRSVLNYHPLSIPHLSILERLIKENGKWRYIAGQDYPREIKTVREIMLGE